MILLAWRSLLARKASVLAALLTVALGAGLVTAAMLIGQAGDTPQAQNSANNWNFTEADAVLTPPTHITLNSGLTLDLPAKPRFSAEQLDELRRVPGVESLTVENPFPAYALTGKGRVIGDAFVRSWGHPWTTAEAEDAAVVRGVPPARPDEVAVDREVADAAGADVGGTLTVQLADGLEQVKVTAVVDRAGAAHEHALFFNDETAQRFGGQPFAAFAQLSDPAAAEELRSHGVVVRAGADKAGAVVLDLRQAELSGSGGQFVLVMAVLALTIAVFVISSTLSVSVQQRRGELAMLRTVGTGRRHVRRLIVAESVGIGLFGGTVGAVLGIGLAALGIDFFAAQQLLPRESGLELSLLPILAGIGAAVLVALLASWLPARRAVAVPPLEAMRSAQVEPHSAGRRRTVWGVLCLVVGLASMAGVFVVGGPLLSTTGAVALQLLTLSGLALLLAVVLLGPMILRLLVVPIAAVSRKTFVGFVATRSILADQRRAAGVAVPLILMITVSSLLLFQDSANFQAQSRGYAKQLSADLVISGQEQLGITPAAVGRARSLDGVEAVSGTTSTQIISDQPGMAQTLLTTTGVDPQEVSRVLNLQLTHGKWGDFTDNAVAVSDAVARERDWKPGEQIDFRYPDGTPASAAVAVLYDDPTGRMGMLLPMQRLRGHLAEPFASAAYVTLAPGVDAERVRDQLSEQLAEVAPGATVLNRADHLAEVSRQSSGDNWIITMTTVILAGYAGIAAINVLISSTMARRRQYALFRLSGAQRRHVFWAVIAEVSAITIVAVVVGTALSAAVLAGYGYLLTGEIWLPFLPEAYLVILAATLLTSALGTIGPARVAISADPMKAAG